MSVLAASMAAFCASTLAPWLDVLDGGDDLAGLYMVALFDVEVSDAAEGGRADVDIGLGFDLAGAAYRGGEVLANNLTGDDLGIAGLRRASP